MSPQSINTALPKSTINTSAATTKTFKDMTSEDFFGLLIAQLQSQDPLKPTDNQTLMTQMSTIKQMENSSSLDKTLTSLATSQRSSGAAGLIGRYVAGTVRDNSGNNVKLEGVVTGVHFDPSGQAILELHNGGLLPVDKVQAVTMVQNLPQDVQQQLALGLGAANNASQRVIAADPGSAAAAQRVSATQPFQPQNGLFGNALRALFGTGAGVGVNI